MVFVRCRNGDEKYSRRYKYYLMFVLVVKQNEFQNEHREIVPLTGIPYLFICLFVWSNLNFWGVLCVLGSGVLMYECIFS